MRTRISSGEVHADSEAVASAVRDPGTSLRTMIFPNSDWEMYKWNREDALGFSFSVCFVLVILGLLWIAV